MLFSSVISFFALAAAGVSAHGVVNQIKADGKIYKGPVAGGAKIKSPIRQISTTSPWTTVTGAGQTCGRNAQKAFMVATVTAGSVMELSWEDHPGTKWQHNMGPIIDYLAKVPTGQTADTFDAAQGNFFKIQQVGQSTGSRWVMADTLQKGLPHKLTIPKGVQNGDYILRHELVALHLADKKGGAEFYTSCIQIRVTGGSTAAVTASKTAKFPGGYSASEAGIFTPNVFNPGFKYTFPGPAIATLSKGAGVAALGSAPASSGSAAVSSSIIDETPAATSSTKAAKPTNCKRAQNAARKWSSRNHMMSPPS